ncbi:hypothetical protein BZG02_15290 [Labilibaculum filiforme]|uniref:Uncharacterized protein n=1 Tax=Labilibaculum filiforme TaxID=1940526 RepID=A0A2N3HU14_9BACT|nr:hypothetical protein [Labilibaculum filiforme]PKQ61552.1 hypothetical protein BZG02_15290 [Labilibaculum filiforme]
MTRNNYKKEAKKSLKKSIVTFAPIAGTIAILLGFIIFKSVTVYNNSKLVNYDTELNGKIVKISEYKGQTFILFNGESKYWSIDNSSNHNFDPSFLGDFLILNDTILKTTCSDTIRVIRNNTEYIFLIGDRLLNSKEHSDTWIKLWRERRRIVNEKGSCKE